MSENEISKLIVDAAYHVHVKLGPGLLESVYEAVPAYELKKRGLIVARQQPIPIVYDNIQFDEGFRADLLVNEIVIIELKSVEVIHPVHKKQLLTYLRLADRSLGLLINFGEALIKDGITRIANKMPDGTSRPRTFFPSLEKRFSRQGAKTQSLPPTGHDKTLWIDRWADRIGSYQTFVERSQLISCLLCAFATLRAINLRMI